MRVRRLPILLGVLVLVGTVAVAVLLRVSGLAARDAAYDAVLDDRGATARDVVEAARAPHVAVALDDGTEVWLFEVHDQDGGETRKAAVQVRRPGAAVVERLVAPTSDLSGVGDHAVLHTAGGVVTVVDVDGSSRRVTEEVTGEDGSIRLVGVRPGDGVEPGDVLVGNEGTAYLYRPVDRSVHVVPVTGVKPGTVPVVGVVGGRVWLVDDDGGRTTVRWSADGRRWRSVGYPSAGVPTVVGSPDGSTVALAAVDSTQGPLRTRSLHLVGAGGSVRAVELPRRGLGETSAAWTPDGRLLLGNGDQGWWRLDGGAWTRLDVPEGVWSMGVVGRRLWAFGSRAPADAAWTSDDSGAHWRRLG